MFRFFFNLILIEKFLKKTKMKFLVFKFSKFKKSEVAVLLYSFYDMSYKPIDRSLKNVSVALSKSTEYDVTLTSFVSDLSHSGLSNVYIVCEHYARGGSESLAPIVLLRAVM